MTPKDHHVIDKLYDISASLDIKSLGVRTRVVAAVVHRGEIISIGKNMKKTHPLQDRFKKKPEAIFLHAEVDAIRNAIHKTKRDNFEGFDIFIVRSKLRIEDKKMVRGNSKPCIGCRRAIEHFNFSRVVYFEDENIIDEERP